MAEFNNVFGSETVTPRGKLVFFDFITENTQAKHPQNRFPSDRFDVTLIIPKATDLGKLKEECERVAKEAFKTTEGIELPFADGNEKSMTCMADHIVIRAKSKKQPILVDDNKTKMGSEDEIRGGMQARLIVTPFSYTSGRTKGVTLLLKKAQVFLNAPYDPIGGGAEVDFDDDKPVENEEELF